MNLARALKAVPKEIKLSPWVAPDPKHLPKAGKVGRPRGAWKPKPEGLIEAAAIIYIIGQITTPVTWKAIQAWGNATYGVNYLDDTYKRSVVRYGVKRKPRTRSMPDSLMLECAQLAIIQCIHGITTPWLLVSDRLWITRRIAVTNAAVAMSVRSWMKHRLSQ